jgi:hypothetical protein
MEGHPNSSELVLRASRFLLMFPFIQGVLCRLALLANTA